MWRVLIFFSSLFFLLGCLHLLIRSRDASDCTGVAMSVPKREREDGIDRSTNSILSHLSPFTIYSLLHHSVCSPTPTAPLTTNSSSSILGFYSPSLFPSFFLFLPLSRMFRFKYVSPSVDGVATPVNVTRRSIRVVRKRRQNLLSYFFLPSEAGVGSYQIGNKNFVY